MCLSTALREEGPLQRLRISAKVHSSLHSLLIAYSWILAAEVMLPAAFLRHLQPSAYGDLFTECFVLVDWARASADDLLRCFRAWHEPNWVSTVLMRLPLPWPELPGLSEHLGLPAGSTYDQIREKARSCARSSLVPHKLR